MHCSYHITYKANKYKAVYIIYMFSYLFLSTSFTICHFLLTSLNYLPAKAYGYSVRLFVMLQLLILLWFRVGGVLGGCLAILNYILHPILNFG